VPDLYYYIKSPNELTVEGYNASITLIFENGKLKERRGQTPLTWYIEDVEEVEVRLKKAIQPSA